MRILLSIVLLLALLPSYSGERRVPLLPAKLSIEVRPVALDPQDPARVRVGGLTFLGGVELTSRSPEFGGFSAMSLTGDRFTLLSDFGNVVQFRLDSRWQVHDVRTTAVPDGPGRGWSKLDRDTEALTSDPASGQLWVAFERYNQIWRYAPDFAWAEAHAAPPAMAKWHENSGAEAMTRLRDGSFIVLGESGKGMKKGLRPGLWFAGDPVNESRRGFRFAYRPPAGFQPTEVTELPDGRLVVIDRRFTLRELFTATVSIITRESIRAGGVVRGREIARFMSPVVHDNFEAAAAVREGKDTVLWIVSDDNQLFFQRSLLLKFRLDDAAAGPKRRTARASGEGGPIRRSQQ